MTFSAVIEKRIRVGVVFPPAAHHAPAEFIASISSEVCGVCLQTLTADNMKSECPGWRTG